MTSPLLLLADIVSETVTNGLRRERVHWVANLNGKFKHGILILLNNLIETLSKQGNATSLSLSSPSGQYWAVPIGFSHHREI